MNVICTHPVVFDLLVFSVSHGENMCTHIIGIVYYAEEMLIIIHFKGVGPKLMLSLLRIIIIMS